MKKSELKQMIKEEINRFGELELSMKSDYKFYTKPEKSSIKQLSKATLDLTKAIKTGEGKAINNAVENLQSTYKYYFMVT